MTDTLLILLATTYTNLYNNSDVLMTLQLVTVVYCSVCFHDLYYADNYVVYNENTVTIII